jgi:NagD protein
MERFRGYAFDLDGTIYLGEDLVPCADEVISTLRELGARVAFVSNNPTYTREGIAEKLTRLRVPTSPKDVVNSSRVLVDYLATRAPGSVVFPIGEDPLRRELGQAGFTISEDPNSIETVIASFDRTFTYRKLQIAFDAIRLGAGFIATNADPFCPTPGGGEPDAAAIIAAVEACTGIPVEKVVGKPSMIMARTILAVLGVPPRECLLVGDRLTTDVLMGARAGMRTALVLTGATSIAQAKESEITPDYVLDSVEALVSNDTQ